MPAPPQVASHRPQPFVGRHNELFHPSGVADHRRDLGGETQHHVDFVFGELARVFGLNDQHANQQALIGQRHAEKRLIMFLAGFSEKLESRMFAGFRFGHRLHILGHQTGQPFMQSHAQIAHAVGR